MKATCVVAEFNSMSRAQTALEVLALRHFMNDRVSVITRQDAADLEALEESLRTKRDAAGVGQSAGAGALMAGGMAAPLAIGSLIANFFVAGPLAAVVVGAVAGGAMAPKSRWEIPDATLRSYSERLEDGSILILVQAEGDDLLEAEAGLRTVGPISLECFDIVIDRAEDNDVPSEFASGGSIDCEQCPSTDSPTPHKYS
ncbi:MAG: hypothetical protein U0892_08260 [Pirellulales bacterium]